MLGGNTRRSLPKWEPTRGFEPGALSRCCPPPGFATDGKHGPSRLGEASYPSKLTSWICLRRGGTGYMDLALLPPPPATHAWCRQNNSPTAESFGVSAQIGSGVVRGGPEVRFHKGSIRVPGGSARAAGWCEH